MIFACDPEEIALDFAKLTMLQVFASDLAKGSKPSPARKQVCNVFKKARAIIGTPHHCHAFWTLNTRATPACILDPKHTDNDPNPNGTKDVRHCKHVSDTLRQHNPPTRIGRHE